MPKLSEAANLDGRPGAEILVAVHASCCGASYRAFTFFDGAFRTMGFATASNQLAVFSTAGVGQAFDCVRPGLLALYGYSSDEKAGVYHVSRDLYVPHGSTWRRWKTSSYTVGINSPLAPMGKSGGLFSHCR